MLFTYYNEAKCLFEMVLLELTKLIGLFEKSSGRCHSISILDSDGEALTNYAVLLVSLL